MHRLQRRRSCTLTDENGLYNFSTEHGEFPVGNYTIYKGQETSSSPLTYGISRDSEGNIDALSAVWNSTNSSYDPTERIIVNPPSSFIVQLRWHAVDLDLHVIAKKLHLAKPDQK